MFKRLRIAVLLYLLAFVAAGHYLTRLRTTDWDAPLWVDVHPVNGDQKTSTQSFIDTLAAREFGAIEEFFARESARYGLPIEQPFRINLAPQPSRRLPELGSAASWLHVLLWSLEMRWFTTALHWKDDRPTPDVTVFAVYHDTGAGVALDRSTALEKGLIAVAHVFTSPAANRGANQVVIAHELLHTLGASDKYDPTTNAPLLPHGYAEPEARPLHPQRRAEIMAGRIALDSRGARIPNGLHEVVIGAATAREIGWSTQAQ